MQVGLQPLFVKAAVTPVGSVEVEKVTGVVVPLTRVAIIDDEGLVPPWTTVRLAGEGVPRLKSKVMGGFTVTEIDTVLVRAKLLKVLEALSVTV